MLRWISGWNWSHYQQNKVFFLNNRGKFLNLGKKYWWSEDIWTTWVGESGGEVTLMGIFNYLYISQCFASCLYQFESIKWPFCCKYCKIFDYKRISFIPDWKSSFFNIVVNLKFSKDAGISNQKLFLHNVFEWYWQRYVKNTNSWSR